jgi:hypothetical protein
MLTIVYALPHVSFTTDLWIGAIIAIWQMRKMSLKRKLRNTGANSGAGHQAWTFRFQSPYYPTSPRNIEFLKSQDFVFPATGKGPDI